MNREIKFRAWDSDNEKMHYSGSMEFIAYDYSIGCCIGITLNEGWKNPYRYSAKLMQYTGLKDKNGKEIYEGDVLKSPYPNCKNIEIKWMTGGCCNFVATGWDWDQECIKNFEVIGNIYENPELI